jgi:general secretion pathway protein M
MTMQRVIRGSWQSRGLALALLAAGIWVCGGLIVRPLWQTIAANEQSLQTEATLLGRLKDVAAFADQLGAQTAPGETLRFKADFLEGEQEAIMAADLQTRLRGIIVGQNSELMSARALPSRVVGSLTVLGLKLQIRGPIADIQQILHTIETGTPLLWVGYAQLGLELRRSPGSGMPLQSRNMTAELDVYGAKWPTPAVTGVKQP